MEIIKIIKIKICEIDINFSNYLLHGLHNPNQCHYIYLFSQLPFHQIGHIRETPGQ